MMLRLRILAALALLTLGSSLVAERALGTTPPGGAREFVGALFGGDGEPVDESTRAEARRGLLDERAGVRDAVVRELRQSRNRARPEIEFRSRLHDAILVAGSWRVSEARSELVAILGARLNPSSIPTGVLLHGGGLYPAAGALAAIGGSPGPLVRAMNEENYSIVLWVMTEAYGRDSTVCILRGMVDGDGTQMNLLRRAVARLESVERTADLLPRWER